MKVGADLNKNKNSWTDYVERCEFKTADNRITSKYGIYFFVATESQKHGRQIFLEPKMRYLNQELC